MVADEVAMQAKIPATSPQRGARISNILDGVDIDLRTGDKARGRPFGAPPFSDGREPP